MRRIFVSHSAKSKADQDYLRAIVDGLRKADFEVFVDYSELQVGNDWIRKISNQLVYCQGAVFLVSEQSIASPFVQHEISSLLVRWRREGGSADGDGAFILAPVLLEDVEAKLARHKFWKAIRFMQVQCMKPAPAESVLDTLVGRFLALPDPGAIEDPLANLEGQIQAILGNYKSSLLLKTAAHQASKVSPFPIPSADDEKQVVTALARALLLAPVEAGHRFVVALGVGALAEHKRNLFDLIAPFWVSREAATRLEHVRVAIVNGTKASFTSQMYLCRWRNAVPRAAGVLVEVAGMANGSVASARLRAEIANALALAPDTVLRPLDESFEQDLRNKIEGRDELFGPYLVCIPTHEADIDAVVEVTRDPLFAGVKFVLLCTEADDDTRERYGPDPQKVVEWLSPDLGDGQEEYFFTRHVKVSKGLG